MKKVILLFSLFLFILSYAIAEAGSWLYLGSDTDNNDHYYNDAVTYYSDGIVGVWLKTVWSEQGKLHLADEIDRRGMSSVHSKNLHHTLGLYKINCTTCKETACSGTVYDKQGKIISDIKFSDKWVPIDRDSLMDAAYRAICLKEKKDQMKREKH